MNKSPLTATIRAVGGSNCLEWNSVLTRNLDLKHQFDHLTKKEAIKSFILPILCLGFLNFLGISLNPIDPPVIQMGDLSMVNEKAPLASTEANTLLSPVDVIVEIKISDCHDYTCEAKYMCDFHIYLYQGNTYLGNIAFDPNTCNYEKRVRADEYSSISAVFVADYPGCDYSFNNNPAQSNMVPFGGGNVTINIQFCE